MLTYHTSFPDKYREAAQMQLAMVLQQWHGMVPTVEKEEKRNDTCWFYGGQI